jgi:signal transduction histidine kinase
MKLFHKFLLFILPCLIVSIIMTGGILSWTNSRFFDRNIDSNYRNILKASAGEIREYVQDAQRDLESLAAVLTATKVDLFRQEMALIGFREVASYFDYISIISPDGQILATTELIGNDAGNLHGDKTFEKAVSGQSAISEVKSTKENVSYAHIAVPIRQLTKVSAVIWGKLNLKSVWEVLEGIRIGETGQVYLMDLEGKPIAHREMDKVVRALPMVSAEVLGKLLESSASPVGWNDTANGMRSYCLGSVIPKLDWIIVLTQDERETHSFVYQNVKWAMVLTALACLAAACAGWLVVRRILRPIHNLHRQVQKIGEGDLDQRVTVESRDEIGDLSAAFNKMASSLKVFIRQQVETAKELAHARNLATLGMASSKVTHEVGNLLSNIALSLLTLKSESISSKGSKSIEIIERESVRVREFIQNFLQFAKKPQLRLHKASLDSTILELLEVHQPEAETRGIQLHFDWSADLPRVRFDSGKIYQVLNNLIKNSLEVIDGSGSIVIGGRVEEDYLQLSIEDTGPGIEPDVLASVFDPFFTTKGAKGTGLGLAICKTIMEAHRGTIECRSKPGEGTTFLLKFPLS